MDDAGRLYNFIEQLNELHVRSGKLSFAKLSKLSESVSKSRPLSRSTINDVLNHKRKGWPEWTWIATFVKTCCECAEQHDVDLGELADLSDWHSRFVEGNTDPCEFDDELLRQYTDFYGRTGARLLRRAGNGDGEAMYQLAVLSLCDRRNDEARRWLRCASRCGHPDAPGLSRRPDPERVDAARDAAFQVGRGYERSGSPTVAIMFYRRAAQSGHITAAEQLSELHSARGDSGEAQYWRDWASACQTNPIQTMVPATWKVDFAQPWGDSADE